MCHLIQLYEMLDFSLEIYFGCFLSGNFVVTSLGHAVSSAGIPYIENKTLLENFTHALHMLWMQREIEREHSAEAESILIN